jgi:hypothetical protein
MLAVHKRDLPYQPFSGAWPPLAAKRKKDGRRVSIRGSL